MICVDGIVVIRNAVICLFYFIRVAICLFYPLYLLVLIVIICFLSYVCPLIWIDIHSVFWCLALK